MDKEKIKKATEALNPTAEQKEKMLGAILEKNVQTPIHRLKPIFVAAIFSCCLFATTAFAAVYLGLDMRFFNFLKLSDNQQAEILGSGAYTVDKKMVDKNGILEIKQVIGDSNLTYILMDFTATEGVALNAERYRFSDCNVLVDTYHDSFGYGFTKLEDENMNDNKISLMMTINTQQSLAGGNIQLSMKNLDAASNLPKTFKEAAEVDPEAQVFKPQIYGCWETSFKLDFEDFSRTYLLDRKITLYGYGATLQSVAVSPISVTVKIASPHVKELFAASQSGEVEYDTYLDGFPVTIHYKDGTQETTTYLTGMAVGDNLTNTIVSVKKFEKVINDKEIQTIEFFDSVIMID